MNHLLDTRVLLWALNTPDRLPPTIRNILEDGDQQIWFSTASLWEIQIKSALGRSDFAYDAKTVWNFARTTFFLELTIEASHVFQLKELARLHADPFDRLLLAQARATGMNLLTVDEKVQQYLTQ